jgi:hypothetical protein
VREQAGVARDSLLTQSAPCGEYCASTTFEMAFAPSFSVVLKIGAIVAGLLDLSTTMRKGRGEGLHLG